MASATRRLRACIDLTLLSGLVLSAGCSGHGSATNGPTSAPTVAVASGTPPGSGGAATSLSGTASSMSGTASGTSAEHQMFLLTQKGIDEDIGFVQSTTTFFDCERRAGVGLLNPHKLLAVGYSPCDSGKALAAYVKSEVGPSGRPADVATLVKLGLSSSPESRDRIQAVARRDLSADPARASLIATKMQDLAQGSGP